MFKFEYTGANGPRVPERNAAVQLYKAFRVSDLRDNRAIGVKALDAGPFVQSDEEVRELV